MRGDQNTKFCAHFARSLSYNVWVLMQLDICGTSFLFNPKWWKKVGDIVSELAKKNNNKKKTKENKRELDINIVLLRSKMDLNENLSKIFANLYNRIHPISSSWSTMFSGLNFSCQDQHCYTRHLSCLLSSIASLY